MIDQAIVISIGIVALSYAVAVRLNIALIALGGLLFSARDFYYFFFEHQELIIEQYSLLLMSVTALTALLLMFRRWPSLWMVITAQAIALSMSSEILVDDKILAVGFYVLCGIALPLLYAFKPRETAFKSAMTEVAAISFITFGYCAHLFMQQIYQHNKIILNSVGTALRWAYQLPLNSFVLNMIIYSYLAALSFLCAELLFYLARDENQPIAHAYFYAAFLLCLMAIIQPNDTIRLTVVGIAAAYLLIKFGHTYSDKRAFWYVMALIAIGALIITKKQFYEWIHTVLTQLRFY